MSVFIPIRPERLNGRRLGISPNALAMLRLPATFASMAGSLIRLSALPEASICKPNPSRSRRLTVITLLSGNVPINFTPASTKTLFILEPLRVLAR